MGLMIADPGVVAYGIFTKTAAGTAGTGRDFAAVASAVAF